MDARLVVTALLTVVGLTACDLFTVDVYRPDTEALISGVTVGGTTAAFVRDPLPRVGQGASPISRGAYYLSGSGKVLLQVQPGDAPAEVLVGLRTDPSGHYVIPLSSAQPLQPIYCIVLRTDPAENFDPFGLSVAFRGSDVSRPIDFAFEATGFADGQAGTTQDFCWAGLNSCLQSCAVPNPLVSYGQCASWCRITWNCSGGPGSGGPGGPPPGFDPGNPIDTIPPDQSIVPLVTGSPFDAARATIQSVDLQVGTVTTVASPGSPPGTVVNQSPSGGTQVAVGSAVDLSISSPLIPDVRGTPLAQARAALAAAGYVVGNVTPAQSPSAPGSVVSQSPSAGSPAQAGATIHLVASTRLSAERVWSDQFQGIEANGLPLGAGEVGEDNLYVLMGTRDDRVFASARLTIVPDDPSIRSQVLVRLSRMGSAVSEGVGPLFGDVAALSTRGDVLPSTTDYVVVAGVDTDGDDQLSVSEEYVRTPWRLRVVNQALYVSERLDMTAAIVGGSLIVGDVATARAFALSFLADDDNGAIKLGGVEYPFSYVSYSSVATEHPLDHHVGLRFDGSGHGTIKNFFFPETSALADSVLASDGLAAAVRSVFDEKVDSVRTEFLNTGSGLFNFQAGGTISFGGDDVDLGLSLGAATFDLEITTLVTCTAGRIVPVTTAVQGTGTDLYDWNYEEGGLDTRFARVQAGYGTLGNGGNVFRIEVRFEGAVTVTDWDFGDC